MESWRKFLPDYRIAEWNERNFVFSDCTYARKAYAAKKWAFVADYARLRVLYEYGGIYLDTDMQVLRPFDDLPLEQGFLAKEQENRYISAGVIAAPKHCEWIAQMLEYYESRTFALSDSMGDETIVTILTRELCRRYDIDLANPFACIPGGPALLEADRFYPPMKRGGYALGAQTYTIHHAQGSWLSWPQQARQRMLRRLTRIFGAQCVLRMAKCRRFLLRPSGKTEDVLEGRHEEVRKDRSTE